MDSRTWSRRDLIRTGLLGAASVGLSPLAKAAGIPAAPAAVVFDALGEIRTVYTADLVERILDSGTRAISITLTDPKVAEADAFDLLLRDLAGYNLYLRGMGSHYIQATSIGAIDQAVRTRRLAVFYNLQDSSPVGGDLSRVALLRRLGITSIQLTYNSRNRAGSGCFENPDNGLTGFGRELVAEMERQRVLLARAFNAMTERLCELLDRQNQLMRDISHDLRTPLARQRVAIELAADSGIEPDLLDSIQRQNERLEEMTGQILTLYRVSGGRDGLEREPVTMIRALNDVLRDAADYAAQLARNVGKVVFFAKHIDVMDAAEESFAARGIRYTSIRGDQTPAVRQRNIDEFTEDPDVAVIVCSLSAAGVGVNLQAASNLVLAELSWTDAEQTQAIDRIHRIGQAEPVTAWRIIAAQTIDTRIAELIGAKAGLAARALDGSDDEVQDTVDFRVDTLAALLTDALTEREALVTSSAHSAESRSAAISSSNSSRSSSVMVPSMSSQRSSSRSMSR